MRLEDAEDLSRFVDELQKETDRGLSLVCAALIDDKLQDTLMAFFADGNSGKKLVLEGNAPLGTFSSRVEACLALGLIDEFEYAEINLIRKIRNEFAHAKHGISFESQKIAGLCTSLTTPLPEDADYDLSDPRWRFKNSAVSLVLRLYYRPEYVMKEKREIKEWVNPDATRWRKVEDEPPPADRPFIAVGKRKRKKDD